MTVSFHKYGNDFFPCTGNIDEIGTGLASTSASTYRIRTASMIRLLVSLQKRHGTMYYHFPPLLHRPSVRRRFTRIRPSWMLQSQHRSSRRMRSISLKRSVCHCSSSEAEDTQSQRRPLLAYETSVLTGCSIPDTLPSTPYMEFFAPTYRLHEPTQAGRVENQNSKASLEKFRVQILEQLRYLHGAPSVQMQELPPDLAGAWVEEEVKV